MEKYINKLLTSICYINRYLKYDVQLTISEFIKNINIRDPPLIHQDI